MKKLTLLLVLPFFCLMLFPCISEAIGFDGFGAKVAFIIPKGPIDNAVGFGAVATLGSIFSKLPALKAEASADYWSKSYDSLGSTVKFTSVSFNGTAKYYFSSEGISPFAGAGLGLVFSKSSFEVSEVPGFTNASNTNTDLGLHLCGGVDIPIGIGTKITVEGRYTTGGGDTFQIIGAFVVKLK